MSTPATAILAFAAGKFDRTWQGTCRSMPRTFSPASIMPPSKPPMPRSILRVSGALSRASDGVIPVSGTVWCGCGGRVLRLYGLRRDFYPAFKLSDALACVGIIFLAAVFRADVSGQVYRGAELIGWAFAFPAPNGFNDLVAGIRQHPGVGVVRYRQINRRPRVAVHRLRAKFRGLPIQS